MYNKTGKSIIILATILAFAGAIATLSPQRAASANSLSLSRTDIIGLGRKNEPGDDEPMLFRIDISGNMVWERELPFTQLAVPTEMADRNLTEDAFYVNVSYYGWNKLDGKARIQKYDDYGNLVWELGLASGGGSVSANPVLGGIYATAADMGVYRLDGDGNTVWGPMNYDISSPCPDTGGPVYWGAIADVTTGGAYVVNACLGVVLKIDGDGNETWRVSIPYGKEGLGVDPNPLDGGAYVAAGGYGRHTYKLDATGNTEWVKNYWPTNHTYERAVSPVDGALYISAGWPPLQTKVAPDGTVLWSVPNDDGAGFNVGGYGLAADIEENYFYTGDGYGNLGISKFIGSGVTTLIDNSSLIWHVDPGYYPYTGGYGPVYRVWTGMPSFVQTILAAVNIDPDTLNLKSKGKWITVYIELPDGYNVADINVGAMILEGTIPAEDHPTEIDDYDDDGITDLMVKFDRQALIEYLNGTIGEVTLTLCGELSDGALFEGNNTITVINPGKK